MGRGTHKHYKNFHKKFNYFTRVFTLSGQKLLGIISVQAPNSQICQEHFCGMESPGSTHRRAPSVGH